MTNLTPEEPVWIDRAASMDRETFCNVQQLSYGGALGLLLCLPKHRGNANGGAGIDEIGCMDGEHFCNVLVEVNGRRDFWFLSCTAETAAAGFTKETE